MRKYLALFVVGNIIGRDRLGFFGLELHGRRKAPQYKKEQEYHGMGDRGASPLLPSLFNTLA
jgi:hypothetical protein